MKKLPFPLPTVALALALAACGLSPEAALERAESAYAAHEYTQARLDLATYLKDQPDDLAALELYARTQLQLGDGEGAAATLARVQAAGATPTDFAALQAEAELLRGQYAGALELAQRMNDANGARIAALAHIGLGDTDAALAAFTEGMQREGEISRLAADFAIFVLRGGDLQRAAEHRARTARISDPSGLDALLASAPAGPSSSPRSARSQIRYLLARYVAEDSDWAQVRDLLQDAPGESSAAAQMLYGRSLVELKLHEQAISQLSGLLRREPELGEARRLLARAQQATGNADMAYATIQPLAGSAKGIPADTALLAEAARLAGKADGSAAALAAAPPAERLAMLLASGDQALREGRWRAAIDAYEQLRGWTGDSNALVLNNLAYARSQTGARAEALVLARKALALAPENPSIKDTAGWLMVQTGEDRARGVALLREASRLAPDNAAIARHLAHATSA